MSSTSITSSHPSPFFFAESSEQLRKKIEEGGDVNARFMNGPTLLSYYAAVGNEHCARTLLELGADPNPPNDSPLVVALQRQNYSLAHHLVQKGADVNHGMHSGQPALMDIIHYSPKEANVAFLLQYKADPNLTDAMGRTPLMDATEKGYVAIVRLLLEHGADPKKGRNIKLKNGAIYHETPLTIAKQIKNEELQSLLRAYGA